MITAATDGSIDFFLGSFRLNSNHNYFPIAVVAQTLRILGCSTPIIKEKALFFKTDIRNS